MDKRKLENPLSRLMGLAGKQKKNMHYQSFWQSWVLRLELFLILLLQEC